jgi:F0F1-type ATP synthase delta subunit
MRNDSYLTSVRTVSDKKNLLKQIEKVTTGLYQNNQPVIYRNQLQKLLRRLGGTAVVKSSGVSGVRDFLTEAAKQLQNLPTVSITIARPLTKKAQKTISAKVKMLINQEAVIDFSVDRTIISGAQITFKGIYRDYSLKKEINSFLEHSKTPGV